MLRVKVLHNSGYDITYRTSNGSTWTLRYNSGDFEGSTFAPLRILGFTFGTGRAKRH